MAGASEDVRRTDEACDEGILWALVDGRGRPDLLDPPLVEDGEAVAHRQRFLLIVGDVDEGDPDLANGALDPLQLDLHLLAELQVECAERLVEQQYLRVVDERPSERNPLALATRKLDRLPLAEPRKLDHFQDLVDAQPALATSHSPHAQPVADVLGHGHVRKEGVILEDRVDVAAVRRPTGDVVSGELDPALVGPLETGDQPQRCRFARARGPEQGEKLAARDFEVDAVDGDNVAIGLADADEPNVRHVHAGRRDSGSVFLNGHYSARIISMPRGATQRRAAPN